VNPCADRGDATRVPRGSAADRNQALVDLGRDLLFAPQRTASGNCVREPSPRAFNKIPGPECQEAT